ncbi:hypothetical protein SADUNF_Sadunf16G0275200 [Salix dunnii]|uniref:Uncharacterized protein n=1 Tax=Salix dunnii TaxID=1413687 RepID=A0A835JAS6_9ROSI|nr:hypothetical protein SADUNF_Sadunf16G0275200 [Salix dunnii]
MHGSVKARVVNRRITTALTHSREINESPPMTPTPFGSVLSSSDSSSSILNLNNAFSVSSDHTPQVKSSIEKKSWKKSKALSKN